MQSPQDLFLKYKQHPQEQNFILLLQAIQPIIYAVCYKVVKNEADCLDVTQDVLVKLIREIHQLKKVEVILGWVHQIAFYTALEFKRNQIKHRAFKKDSFEINETNSFDDSSLVLHEHISKLDKESQQLILLKFFDNKTFEEIFAKTGKAYSSAHREIQKILLTLKASLEKAGYLSISISVENILESYTPSSTTKLILNQVITKEIKIALQKKMANTIGLSNILPLAGVMAIAISIISISFFSSLGKKVDEKQKINLTQKPISKKEETKNDDLKKSTNISEDLIDNIFSSDHAISAIEKPKDEKKTGDEKDSYSQENVNLKKQTIEIEESKNEFYFINEKGDSLFGGKVIILQLGNVEIEKGVDISFKRDENQKLLVGVKSKEYFISSEKNDRTFKGKDFFARFEVLEKSNPIILSSNSVLKVIFQSKNGITNFKDGTLSSIFGSQGDISDNSSKLMIEKTITKDNFALFYTRFSGQVNLEKIFVGNNWGKINKTIELNFGETTEVLVDVEQGKEQVFQVLDNNNRPMENCFVYFTEENYFRKTYELDIKDYKKIYSETGNLPLGDTISLTDNNGFAKTNRFFDLQSEVFECYVFSKTHGMQIFQISSENKSKIIELKMKNPAHLSLIVKLNNEIYLNDIEFNCPFLFISHGEDIKLPTKIVNGRLEVPNILADKYILVLSSNEFQRDELVIDLTNSEKLEYVINLNPAENFIHGYVIDKNGTPLEDINLSFHYKKLAYHLTTNNKGYYKFSRLDAKTSCLISVNSDRPVTSDLHKDFLPSNEEINIVLGEADFFSLKVVGLDGKFLNNFSYELVIYPIQGGITVTNGVSKNGEVKEKLDTYGQYHFTIEIKGAPSIKKIIPILKAEDNVPIVLSAVPGFFIGITTLSPDGIPMEDVIVTKDADLDLAINPQPSLFLITDKSGFFKLENCLVGDFFWLKKKGFSPIPLEIKEENINARVNKTFTKSFSIKGLLHSTKPFDSIKIQGISKYNSKYAYYVYSQVKADGSFTIDGLNSGDWLFNIYPNNNQEPLIKRNINISQDTILNFDLDSPAPSSNAIKIIEVMENSVAKKSGLEASDLIIKYAGKRTLNLKDLNQAKNEAMNDLNTKIQILRKGKIQDIKISTGQMGIAIEEVYDESVLEKK